MIFNRRKAEEVTLVDIGNENWVSVPMEVGEYIDSLKRENEGLKFKTERLEKELGAIKPIVANPTLTQAVSKYCYNCKYVVKSSWNNQVLRCMKDSVCEDFVPREESE